MLVERTTVGLHSHLQERFVGYDRRSKILDVGCGTGAWLARLERLGFGNLLGVDREECDWPLAAVDRKVLDLDMLGWESTVGGPFDVITCIEVVEHVENLGVFLDALANLMGPHSTLWVTTPNIHSIESRVRFLLSSRMKGFDAKGDPTHVFPVYMDCLERLLRRRGLVVASQFSYPDRGTRVSSWPIKLAGRVGAVLVGDPLPGDNLILRIERQTSL